MANNRIYIKCRACGEMLFLGKRLGFGYYWENYGKNNNKTQSNNPKYTPQDERPLEDRLNEFYDKHWICEGFDTDTDDGWPDVFEISYESEPCWKMREVEDE